MVGSTTVRMKIQLIRLRLLGGSVQTGGGEANWCGRRRCTSGAATADSAVAATEVVLPVAGRFGWLRGQARHGVRRDRRDLATR